MSAGLLYNNHVYRPHKTDTSNYTIEVLFNNALRQSL